MTNLIENIGIIINNIILWLGTIANALIRNEIFQIMLGVILFTLLFGLIIGLTKNIKRNKKAEKIANKPFDYSDEVFDYDDLVSSDDDEYDEYLNTLKN